MTGDPSPRMFAAADGLATRSSDAILLVVRIVIGWLFMTNGWAKLMNMSGAARYLTSLKVPNPGFWVWPSCVVFDRRGAMLSRQLATQSLKPQQVQDYRCTPITCQHSGNGAGLRRQIEC